MFFMLQVRQIKYNNKIVGRIFIKLFNIYIKKTTIEKFNKITVHDHNM